MNSALIDVDAIFGYTRYWESKANVSIYSFCWKLVYFIIIIIISLPPKLHIQIRSNFYNVAWPFRVCINKWTKKNNRSDRIMIHNTMSRIMLTSLYEMNFLSIIIQNIVEILNKNCSMSIFLISQLKCDGLKRMWKNSTERTPNSRVIIANYGMNFIFIDETYTYYNSFFTRFELFSDCSS